MDALQTLLSDAARAGVFQLTCEPREVAQAADAAGLACFRIDIGHAHDKGDFLRHLQQSMAFPEGFGANWDALFDCLKDLAWIGDAATQKGFVVVLERSKHFGAGHRHEFEDAMSLMQDVAEYWRGQGRPFWTLIGGPEGWQSGYPAMAAS